LVCNALLSSLLINSLDFISGIVYLGINIISKAEVAIKFESADVQLSQLQHEFEVYQSLIGDGIPSVQWFGTEGDYNALVLTRLGPSLEDLFNHCNRKFSLKTVLLLADQMVHILAEICN
jgi:casein kinase I family protein HRR25